MTLALLDRETSTAPSAWLRAVDGRDRLTFDDRPGLHVTTRPDTGTADLAVLLEKIAAGDAQAFADFYDRTGDRVYGMVLRVLRDPGYSEETTQEVYLQVWRSASNFDPASGSPLSWLITLAHHRAVDRVRSETASTRRDITYGVGQYSSTFDSVSEEAGRRETSAAVIGCLGQLSDVQRESVDLAYYHGLTYREVAERLSVALPTVKSRIRDGLARLRTCLGDRDV